MKKVDVRIVATSNRNLGKVISEGLFREDLYHRLVVFPMTVPPLRDRHGDVKILAEHFVEKYCDLLLAWVQVTGTGFDCTFQRLFLAWKCP